MYKENLITAKKALEGSISNQLNLINRNIEDTIRYGERSHELHSVIYEENVAALREAGYTVVKEIRTNKSSTNTVTIISW